MNRFARTAVALAAGTALALAAPLAASAHVTLDGNTAAAGSFTLLTFKVPNESATESTTTVELALPADTPFDYVSYVPVAGWTTELVRTDDVVTSVVWTADDGVGITDGQLVLFPLSVGPVPDTGSIVLPVSQTYTDGTVVAWDQTEEGADNPAPVLYVNDAPVADHHADGDEHSEEDAEVTATETTASGDDMLARGLGIGGLVLGAIGLVVGLTARRKPAAE